MCLISIQKRISNYILKHSFQNLILNTIFSNNIYFKLIINCSIDKELFY